MLQQLRGPELLILLLLLVLLFGARRLPDAARGLGRSLRIFKAETKGLAAEASDSTSTTQGTTAAAPVEPPAAQGDEQRA